MPARWTTWVTPSSSPDQSAGRARSGIVARSTPLRAGIEEGSREAALTCQPSLGESAGQALADKARGPGDQHALGHLTVPWRRRRASARWRAGPGRYRADRRRAEPASTVAIARPASSQPEQKHPRRHLRHAQALSDGALIEMRAVRRDDLLSGGDAAEQRERRIGQRVERQEQRRGQDGLAPRRSA